MPSLRYFLTVVAVCSAAFVSSEAFAISGCSRQPQPGDGLNCGFNGPYHPNQNNGVDCRSQCNALKNCLNNPPGQGCQAQRDNLNNCMRQNVGGRASASSQQELCPVMLTNFEEVMYLSMLVSGTIADELGVPESQLQASDDLYRDFGVSPKAASGIKRKIEARLGISIPDSVVPAFRNMNQIEQAISREVLQNNQ